MPIAGGSCLYRQGRRRPAGRRPPGLPVLIVQPIPSSRALHWHPSVDRLVDSALNHMSANSLIGVLLTGMGNDVAAARPRASAAWQADARSPRSEETARSSGACRARWSRRAERISWRRSTILPIMSWSWSAPDERAARSEREDGRSSRQARRPISARLAEFLYHRRTGMSFGETKRYYIERRVAERQLATLGRRTSPIISPYCAAMATNSSVSSTPSRSTRPCFTRRSATSPA